MQVYMTQFLKGKGEFQIINNTNHITPCLIFQQAINDKSSIHTHQENYYMKL